MSTRQKREKLTKEEKEKRASEVIARLMSSVQKVDMKAPDAQANETTMDDNNGGRIIYVLKKHELLMVKGKYVIVVDNKKKTLELQKNKK